MSRKYTITLTLDSKDECEQIWEVLRRACAEGYITFSFEGEETSPGGDLIGIWRDDFTVNGMVE